MKIDSAVKEFTERYDREAIASIDRVSQEFGLGINKTKIGVFNINEAGKSFKEVLLGYQQYHLENIGNTEVMPYTEIASKVSEGLPTLFEAADVLYTELPSFVSGYISVVTDLQETVNQVKEKLLESGGGNEAIGSVNDLTDRFMEAFDAQFETAMNRILWASGYNSKQALKPKAPKTGALKPVFL